jgi:hypothetical protein
MGHTSQRNMRAVTEIQRMHSDALHPDLGQRRRVTQNTLKQTDSLRKTVEPDTIENAHSFEAGDQDGTDLERANSDGDSYIEAGTVAKKEVSKQAQQDRNIERNQGGRKVEEREREGGK